MYPTFSLDVLTNILFFVIKNIWSEFLVRAKLVTFFGYTRLTKHVQIRKFNLNYTQYLKCNL